MTLLRVLIAFLVLPVSLRADDDAQRVLAELNLARTQPRHYARIVAQNAGGKQSRAVKEAIRFLAKAKPRSPLLLSPGLSRAALDHVLDQGPSGGRGHVGRNGQRSFHRISRHGRWLECVGENIDYGVSDARKIVVRLIVDEGVRDRGHRLNVFRESFRVVGIAVGAHARYQTMCVMDFAGGFVEPGGIVAQR